MNLYKSMAIVLISALTITSYSCNKDEEEDVDDQGPTPEEQNLSGSYDDLHLTNIYEDPSMVDYTVKGDIDFAGTLTIDPGVKIEFEEDTELHITSTGIFKAIGSSDHPIIFTSAEIAGGKHWKGIRINSTDIRNEISHAVVEYAGNSKISLGTFNSHNTETNIAVNDDAVLTINHTEISNSKNFGLYVRGTLKEHNDNNYKSNGNAALGTHIRNVDVIDDATTFSDNIFNGVDIRLGGTLTHQATWTQLHESGEYKVSDDILIAAPLTIHEGCFFNIDEDVLINVFDDDNTTSDSYIEVKGTQNMPVVFTTSNLAGGRHWKGIVVKTPDARNKMDYVTIEYAGNSDINIGAFNSQNRATNLAADSEATLSISNANIKHSKGWGIAAIADANLTLENIDYEGNAEGDLDYGD